MPDETTILNFRHWLEKNKIAEEMFEGVNLLLQDFGLMVRQGTIVDATIIDAPSSTKNAEGARDPDLVHAVVGTPANAADVTQVAGLLHGEEALVFGDAGYQGVDKREEHQGRDVQWSIAMRPSKLAQMRGGLARAQLEIEHRKASLQSAKAKAS